MKFRKSLMISLAMIVWLVVALVSCAPKPEPPLRVGTVVWPPVEILYLARSLGYYDDTAIRLVDYGSGSEVIRAYRNGDLEVATLTIYEVLLLAETDPSIRIMLIADDSYGGDVILAKPEIPNLAALKNRRIGVEASALGAFVLTRALEKVNLSIKDVEIVSLAVSEHERAFKEGSVDAVVTFDPVRSTLLAAGANLIFSSREIPGEIVDTLAVHESALQSNSQALNALITGWFRALKYLQENPLDAAARVAPREGLTPEQFLKALEGVRIPNLEQNQKILGKLDTSVIKPIQENFNFLVENKLLTNPVEPTSLFEARLVQQVKKEAL